MSEEIKTVEKEEKTCCVCNLIKCESCRKFLIVALGTFVGGFCALSLFAALHKPPMMGHPMGHQFRHGSPQMERGFGHRPHNFNNGEMPDRKAFKKHFENGKDIKAPEDIQKPENDD